MIRSAVTDIVYVHLVGGVQRQTRHARRSRRRKCGAGAQHTEEPMGAAIRTITSEQLFASEREIERQVSAPAPLPAAAAAGETITFRSQ